MSATAAAMFRSRALGDLRFDRRKTDSKGITAECVSFAAENSGKGKVYENGYRRSKSRVRSLFISGSFGFGLAQSETLRPLHPPLSAESFGSLGSSSSPEGTMIAPLGS